MDQSDIFRLLLIVLLLANSQLSPSKTADEDTDEDDPFNYTTINEVLILAMFLRLFASPDQTTDTNNTTF